MSPDLRKISWSATRPSRGGIYGIFPGIKVWPLPNSPIRGRRLPSPTRLRGMAGVKCRGKFYRTAAVAMQSILTARTHQRSALKRADGWQQLNISLLHHTATELGEPCCG